MCIESDSILNPLWEQWLGTSFDDYAVNVVRPLRAANVNHSSVLGDALPDRFAKAAAMVDSTRFNVTEIDMSRFLNQHLRGAIFEEPHESMILVRDIEIYSMCEHHMLPFFGKAHVAYIPDGKIMGLSKIPRIVDVFARRLQVQERLTDQVADALMRVLEPHGVGVVVEAYHLCMMMRGVEKQNSKTVTSALRGSFLDGSTRDEFLRLAHGGNWSG